MREIDHVWNAVRFLTILPVPDSPGEMAPDWLTRCLKYSPLVGIGIGLVAAIVFLVASAIWGAGVIAALLAIVAGIIVTGALHEDGLADTIDGFGGGWTLEKRLAIMKDSRIGAYGALALGFDIALRVAALAMLPPWIGAAALIAGHASARVAPAFVMTKLSYAGELAAMKVAYVESAPRHDELQFALITVAVAALPLAFISAPALAVGWLFGAGMAAALAAWARRLIGGYTGDVLGGIEQMFEIGFLLGVVAVVG